MEAGETSSENALLEVTPEETKNGQEDQTSSEDIKTTSCGDVSSKDEKLQMTSTVEIKEPGQRDKNPLSDCTSDPKSKEDHNKSENMETPSCVANTSSNDQLQTTDKMKGTNFEPEESDKTPDFECISEPKSEHDHDKSENIETTSCAASTSNDQLQCTETIKGTNFELEESGKNPSFECVSDPKSEHDHKSENIETPSCVAYTSTNDQLQTTDKMKGTNFELKESDKNPSFECISEPKSEHDQSKPEVNVHSLCTVNATTTSISSKGKQLQSSNEIKETHCEPEESDKNSDFECISDTKSEHDQSKSEDNVPSLCAVDATSASSKDKQPQSTEEIKETHCEPIESDTNPDFECISDTKSEHDQTNLDDIETFSCVAKASLKNDKLQHTHEKRETYEREKTKTNLGLDWECISDTKSEHDPNEEADEYYESISEEEPATADIDDISSSEDEHFVDTVPKHSFADLPFVPKAEFSSELLNTVKEEKFDSAENNFNRKPFSSAVQSSAINKDSPQFVPRADFSVPPPNFNYAAPQNYQGYSYDQASYYNTAQQNYEQNPWYGNQAGYDPASYGGQQLYPGSADYQNYSQTAYQNYYQGAYDQQFNNQSNLGVQSAPTQSGTVMTVPFHPVLSQGPNVQNFQLNPSPHANLNVVGNVSAPSSVSVVSKSDSTSSAVQNVSGASVVKKNVVADSVVASEDQAGQTTDSAAVEAEPINRPVSYKPSSRVGNSSPAADWLDENGDPIKGAFDFEAPEDSLKSVEDKSSKVEYVFSVRSSKSAKDQSINTVTNSNTSDTAQTSDNKETVSVTPTQGPSLSEQIAAERAKVSVKAVPLDEEKKLYEASRNGDEYKAALQAALATTSLAKVTPSTSKLLAENALVQKERVNRFKRMQFTNQKVQHEPDQDNTVPVGAAVPFQKSEKDVALESQAINEILKEVQHGAARAKQYGALGWQKNPVPAVNKTFLHNTLVSTLRKPYKPPSKRGGRATQGLHDKDGSRSSSSSRSSRSYSSDSRSSSGSSRSSYTSNSDSDGSRSRGPPGYYEEAWAAYAAQFGYPWMGPDAYGMFYGPDGWPMDPYHPMFYGDPQAWAEQEAFYGPQNFNPRGRGRGFRGRGRDRGRGMEFRGRGRDGDFRGRGGWGPPDFRGGGRGMEFRGGPPRGMSFPPRGRGMGLRYPGGRDFSRSRSRSSSRGSDPERRGSRYKGPSRAGSRKSRSKSRSLDGASDEKRKRDRSQSQSKDGGIEKESENDKSKKKKKKKHRKSKKRKDKDKSENSEGEGENASDKPREGEEAEKGQNDDREEKSKSKKGKKHSKHKKKDGKRKKDKSKEDTSKPTEVADENLGEDNLSKKKPDQDRGGETQSKKDNEQDRTGSEESRQRKKKRKDREQRERSDDNKGRKNKAGDSDDKDRENSTKGDERERPESRDGEYSKKRGKESSKNKEDNERQEQDKRGKALENDLRLKLKAKRQQRLLQDEVKDSETAREKSSNTDPLDSNLKARMDTDSKSTEDRDVVGKMLDEPSVSDNNTVTKKKKIVKKKKDSSDPASVTATAGGEDVEAEPKRKKVVKKKIVVVKRKVIRDSSGAIIERADAGTHKRDLDREEGSRVVAREEWVEGTQTTDGKRKRIIKRTIIVKRKKKKVNPGAEEVETSGNTSVSVSDHRGSQNEDENVTQPTSDL